MALPFILQFGYPLTRVSADTNSLVLDDLRCVNARDTVEFHPNLYAWLMEILPNSRFTFVGKLKRRGNTQVVRFGECLSTNSPQISQIEEGKSLFSFLYAIEDTDASVAIVFLGKFVNNLCQCLKTETLIISSLLHIEKS